MTTDGGRPTSMAREPHDAGNGVALRFDELKRWWQAETAGSSVLSRWFMHDAYQQIIGLGEPAIPLLLDELRARSDWWFWALRAITGDDPVGRDATYNQAVEAWLRWGREHGYE